jgi:hypothetical protein
MDKEHDISSYSECHDNAVQGEVRFATSLSGQINTSDLSTVKV